jgi:hypothetical protein
MAIALNTTLIALLLGDRIPFIRRLPSGIDGARFIAALILSHRRSIR